MRRRDWCKCNRLSYFEEDLEVREVVYHLICGKPISCDYCIEEIAVNWDDDMNLMCQDCIRSGYNNNIRGD